MPKTLTTLLTASLSLLAFTHATAQTEDARTYPSKPVRIVVPFPPGGGNDILGRLVAPKLAELYGQSFLIDNRPGQDGILGSTFVSKAAPDGYTLLVISLSFTTNAHIHKTPYDPIKSFTPVAQIGSGTQMLTATMKLPVNNIRELIDHARAHPGKLRYALTGIGSPGHFTAAMMNSYGKIDVGFVPYKGGAAAQNDTIAGHVELLWGTLVQSAPLIKAGKLKPLGITSGKRSPQMPDIPSINETIPGFEGEFFWGYLAPAGTPRPIVMKLNNAINDILRQPEMVKRLNDATAQPAYLTPEEFGKVIADNLAKWGKVAKEYKITAED